MMEKTLSTFSSLWCALAVRSKPSSRAIRAPAKARAGLAVGAVVLALVAGAARAGGAIEVQGIWEAETPNNNFQIQVSWNPSARRFEGVLVRLGVASRQVGFHEGELIWVATPSTTPAILNVQEQWRSGANGATRGVQWRRGVVYLDRSTADRLVTSITPYRRASGGPPPPASAPSIPPRWSAASQSPERANLMAAGRPPSEVDRTEAAGQTQSGMPLPEAVLARFASGDPQDSAARQCAAFQHLHKIAASISGKVDYAREVIQLLNAYDKAAYSIRRQSSPDARLVAKYAADPSMHGQVMAMLSGPVRKLFDDKALAVAQAQAAAEAAAAVRQQAAEEKKRQDDEAAAEAAKVTAAADAVVWKRAAEDVALATRKGTDLAAFGLRLGKPLDLPTCASDGADVPRCKTSDARSPTIRFASGELPSWTSSYWLGGASGEVRGDRLVSVSFSRIEESDALYDALSAKYGKPTKTKELSFTNGYGIKSTAWNWEWTKAGLHVEFVVDQGQVDSRQFLGDLSIELTSVWQARVAKDHAEADGHAKF